MSRSLRNTNIEKLSTKVFDVLITGGGVNGAANNHIVRASLEAIAYQSAEVLNCMTEDTGNKLKEIRENLLKAYFELECYPEALNVLKTLQEKKFTTGILSNGSPEMLSAAVQNSQMDDVMDSVFSVDSIKLFKPDPKVHALATDGLGCKPENILFFSSNAWDVCGASAFGFQVVWVNRFKQAVERLPGEPVLEIQSFIVCFSWIPDISQYLPSYIA